MGAACCACEKDKAQALSPESTISPHQKKSKGAVFCREELEEAFTKFDADGNGLFDHQELASLLEYLGVRFSKKSLDSLFQALDDDGGGSVGKDEFVEFFSGLSKKDGLGKHLQTIVDKQKAKAMEGRRRKTAKDVYICHAMPADAGLRRCKWLATVLEFADVSCTGPYVRQRETAVGGSAAFMAKSEALLNEDEAELKVSDCACVCVLLDGNIDLEDAGEIVELLSQSAANNQRVQVMYDANKDIWLRLARWRVGCRAAFERPALPISMEFVSDTEQLVVTRVYELLEEAEAPILTMVRPPGRDVDDFRFLAFEGVRWIRPEYVAAINNARTTMMFRFLPEESHCTPAYDRTCYVSYHHEDPVKPGLSGHQREIFAECVKRNRLNDSLFFLEHVSLEEGLLASQRTELVQVLSYSKFVILDMRSDNSENTRPYLYFGQNFLEACIAVLTGLLEPAYDGQFEQLDNALGKEFKSGMNFRRFFRENADTPSILVDNLCEVLKAKEFDTEQERNFAQVILRQALNHHPLLVQTLSGVKKS